MIAVSSATRNTRSDTSAVMRPNTSNEIPYLSKLWSAEDELFRYREQIWSRTILSHRLIMRHVVYSLQGHKGRAIASEGVRIRLYFSPKSLLLSVQHRQYTTVTVKRNHEPSTNATSTRSPQYTSLFASSISVGVLLISCSTCITTTASLGYCLGVKAEGCPFRIIVQTLCLLQRAVSVRGDKRTRKRPYATSVIQNPCKVIQKVRVKLLHGRFICRTIRSIDLRQTLS